MATLSSERHTVQRPLVRYAIEAGWAYLARDDVTRLRHGETGLVLHDVLVAQLQRLNPEVIDDVIQAEEVIKRITRVAPTIEGNLAAWEYLAGLRTVFVESERRERNVTLLDAEHPDANLFHVTEELSFTNGSKTDRLDVVFFINGIPIIDLEAKAATRLDGINEALDQIRRYHREVPELMALLQLYALTHLIHSYYGATWSLTRKTLFNWRDGTTTDSDFESLVKSFIAPTRVLRLLTDFILFTRKDDELSKVVLRPHQMRAVERVVRRAHDQVKHRGLVWHTQGSGKTFTMITVAKQLIEDPDLKNPTVLMLVDRNELEQQLFGNLESVGFGQVVVAKSKRDLRHLLSMDHRGLIVSMIHKFDDIDADMNLRDNIFVLVDEAHRTTGGDLGNYLMGALPNATYIGFTGTPIDRTAHGKGTFKVFGSDDEQGYLDKYSIRESIADGTTVPLHYALAPNDLLVDQETLDREFLSLAELEGVSDPEQLNAVLERTVTLRNMLKNRDRIEKVAAHVARHFTSTIEPMGYKAFLVGVDREACVRLKQALDRHLPPEYSEVVISAAHNDSEELSRFHLSAEQEEAIRKAFRKPDELPKILIVTEKLLTGYDAPILYCMYLDKPMRDHVLLQAIARVNRPFEDDQGRRKPAGFVLDFVGIFDKLEKALAFDSEDVSGVIHGIDVLQVDFAARMEKARQEYLPVTAGLKDDKAADAVLLHFRDQELRHTFYHFYADLEELYEILSPDPFLRPYLPEYQELTAMYRIVRGAYEPRLDVDRDFLRKTALLVQQHTQTGLIQEPRASYDLGVDALEAIASQPKPDTVKIFNLVKAFHMLEEKNGATQPYLIAIAERALEIAKGFEDRQLTTQQTLEKLEELVQRWKEAENSPERRELSAGAYLVYYLLNEQGNDEARTVAQVANAAFAEYPHWKQSDEQERKVRIEMLKALRAAKLTDAKAMTAFTNNVLTVLKRAG
jgi:type I restriction enzyme R subunit